MLKAQHSLTAHEYEAKDILRKLSQGESFEKLAADFSICPSSRQGGNLGEFPKGRMIPAFEKALLELEPGQTSGVVRTQFGHHIIKRL
ncbi:MAG: peptidylprolyl isomerase [Bacteriovoracaceae bacterium]